MEEKDFTEVEFAQMLLELTTASWVDADEFDKFVDRLEIPPGPAKVDFTQRFLAMIKRLPDKLVDVEMKTKIIEAGQEYLDDAIVEEETILDELDALAEQEKDE